ncbi:MAG: radical SAM protein [Candidatus Gastranaerophilaceae bacterium]
MEEPKIELKEEYLVERYEHKEDLPKAVRLEACTICQLNCHSCYMRQDPEGVANGCGNGMLSFKNFKKFVDENNFETIELSNHGEIFLNPELVKMMEYAHKKGIKLTADNGVNLNKLTDEQAEALVKYEFENIVVSIDGASQETYKQYRRNGNFDKVIEHIEKINFYKKKYKSEKPFLNWKFVLFGHNEHEVKKAQRLAKKLKMEIFFATNWDTSFSPVKDRELVKELTGVTGKTHTPRSRLKQFINKEIDWYYCNFLWEAPQINWDGQILGCCSLYDKNFGDNVFKDGFMNALNNPKMIYAKNMITGNAPPLEGIPCTDCYVYKDLKKAKNKLWVPSPHLANLAEKARKLEEEKAKEKEKAAKKKTTKKTAAKPTKKTTAKKTVTKKSTKKKEE